MQKRFSGSSILYIDFSCVYLWVFLYAGKPFGEPLKKRMNAHAYGLRVVSCLSPSPKG